MTRMPTAAERKTFIIQEKLPSPLPLARTNWLLRQLGWGKWWFYQNGKRRYLTDYEYFLLFGRMPL